MKHNEANNGKQSKQKLTIKPNKEIQAKQHPTIQCTSKQSEQDRQTSKQGITMCKQANKQARRRKQPNK